jgi:inner membrane transporter RhtA
VAIDFLGPLAIALIGSRRALDLVWIACAIGGLALLLPFDAQAKPLDPVGVAYALAAAAGWALYIVAGRRAGASFGSDAVALGTAVGACIAVPIGVVHAGCALLSTSVWPFAFGVAVLSSALPYSLEMIALTRLPARIVGILFSLEPVVAALLGLVFLDEHLTTPQWLAIAAIIIASLGAVISAERTRTATSDACPP